MSRPNALVCAALVGLSVAAHAAEKPKLVMVPFAAGEGASEAAAGRFLSLVRDELKTRGDAVELVASPATKAAAAATPTTPTPERRRAPSAEAVGALDAGRKAFDDLRFEDAVASLRKGVAAMLQDPATADYEAVIDAHVKLAAAAFRMGEEKDAKAALLELARLAPDYTLPGGYPPVFQREFDKAKKRLEKQPRGQLSIEGPAGSTAFLDGRDLGMVPVLEENVPAGLHYVKVEGTKGERFGQAVEIKGGLVKVKASFGGGGGERAPVVTKAAVADPGVAALVDEATQGRLSAYAKAANAEYALVAYVYKTSDTQLTAGAALFSVKKGAFSALPPVTFDTDVLTANTEAFKVADEVTRRLTSFGASASLPLNLASRAAKAGTTTVARADTPTNVDPDDVDASTPTTKKVVLVPRPPPRVEQPPLADVEPPPPDEPKPGEVKSGVPAWVWVVAGVAVAAGAGVGGYFVVSEITKPVTGTVTATW